MSLGIKDIFQDSAALHSIEIDIKLLVIRFIFLTGIYFTLFTIKIKNNNLNIGMVYSNHKKQYEKNHVNGMKFKGS